MAICWKLLNLCFLWTLLTINLGCCFPSPPSGGVIHYGMKPCQLIWQSWLISSTKECELGLIRQVRSPGTSCCELHRGKFCEPELISCLLLHHTDPYAAGGAVLWISYKTRCWSSGALRSPRAFLIKVGMLTSTSRPNSDTNYYIPLSEFLFFAIRIFHHLPSFFFLAYVSIAEQLLHPAPQIAAF